MLILTTHGRQTTKTNCAERILHEGGNPWHRVPWKDVIWVQAARSQIYFLLHVYAFCGQRVPEVSFEQGQIAIFFFL